MSHWVTIKGKHVLIDEDGGHDGTHNPAIATGSKTADKTNHVFTKQEMIAQGADGYLSKAKLKMVPVDKIDGLEPAPAASEGNPYVKGKPIIQPVEVVFDKQSGKYILYSGNHRVQQALLNRDKYIPAFVENE